MGYVAGRPRRFIQGHNARLQQRQVGLKLRDRKGYIRVVVEDGHPMANVRNQVYEHRLVMAEAIGRPLRAEEVVHHVNEQRDDNRIENLVLFENNAAHKRHHSELFHRRRAAAEWLSS